MPRCHCGKFIAVRSWVSPNGISVPMCKLCFDLRCFVERLHRRLQAKREVELEKLEYWGALPDAVVNR